MINAEMVENPVLEELEDSVPLLDEVGKKEEDRERAAAATPKKIPSPRWKRKIPSKKLILVRFSRTISIPATAPQRDGGHRAPFVREFPLQAEQSHRPSGLATGSAEPAQEVREAADLIVGNLNEDGYLIASDDELLGIAPPAPPEADAESRRTS